MTRRIFVLVVTPDRRLERQALVAVRAAGGLPVLGHDDEDCPSSLRRIRPDVVLLDSTHPCATSSGFFHEATALGARVVALAPDARHDQAAAVARRLHACCVTLPTEYDRVSDALASRQLRR